VIGDSITFVPKPAPTLGFWLGERLGQGGFCRKVIGDSITFVPKPAPTLGFITICHSLPLAIRKAIAFSGKPLILTGASNDQ
ncbi:MAG: hypothetical protein ACLFT9_25125, partial [Coleofasciculus sp.]